jgi:PPOX class probable F420-dependent enzyme
MNELFQNDVFFEHGYLAKGANQMSTAVISNSINILEGHALINLTTFRKDGTGVSTPVMFAQCDDKLYVVTGKTTGKLKRIIHDARVTLAPCDGRGNILGEALSGSARILSSQEWESMKTRAQWRMPPLVRFVINRIRDLRAGGIVYLEITIA